MSELNDFKKQWIVETAQNYFNTYDVSFDYALAFAYYVAWPRFHKKLIYLVDDNEQEHEEFNH